MTSIRMLNIRHTRLGMHGETTMVVMLEVFLEWTPHDLRLGWIPNFGLFLFLGVSQCEGNQYTPCEHSSKCGKFGSL
jgi:hypothetical protein